jgi:sRNA-binding regulator protein Hfq
MVPRELSNCNISKFLVLKQWKKSTTIYYFKFMQHVEIRFTNGAVLTEKIASFVLFCLQNRHTKNTVILKLSL